MHTLKLVHTENNEDCTVKVFENYFYTVEHEKVLEEGRIFEGFSVRTKKRFTPEILVSKNWKDNTYKVEIQTTSYGSLNLEEYPQFMKCVAVALDTATQIENYISKGREK